MNPSPLTGERLANILEHRHTFFFINPHQRVLQFVPASGSLIETRGGIITAALPFGCGLSVLFAHNHALQKRQSPGDKARAFMFFAAIYNLGSISK